MSSIQEVSAKKPNFLRRSRKAIATAGAVVGSWIVTAPVAYATTPPAPPAPGSGAATGTTAGQGIQDFITAFVGPILTIAIGLIAVKFLVQREMTKFFQFAAIAVLVAVLFFTPNLITNIANWFSGVLQSFFP